MRPGWQCQLPNISTSDGAISKATSGSRPTAALAEIHGTGSRIFSGGFYIIAGPFTLRRTQPAQVPTRRPAVGAESAQRLSAFSRDAIRSATASGSPSSMDRRTTIPAEFSSVAFYYAETGTRSPRAIALPRRRGLARGARARGR
jgi:hypothetical protein